jgi:rhamnosyltransferase
MVAEWFDMHNVKAKNYFLIVGRFVPENNYETMIREFLKSETTKDLVIITNVKQNGFYTKLLKQTQFDKDLRIKFVGTVYNQPLLKFIRENAYGYIHGHEVGGTNPSLLEALSSTQLNLLIDVGFNRDVAKDAALYWNKVSGNLASEIDKADSFTERELKVNAKKAIRIVLREYTWPKIINQYESVFIDNYK